MLQKTMLPLCLLAVVSAGSAGVIWAKSTAYSLSEQDRPRFETVSLLDGRQLHVGRHEVTIGQWNACVTGGGCEPLAKPGQLNTDHPVTGVNWFDVQNYLAWYQAQTGTPVRLPSRLEWMALSRDHAPVEKKPLFTDPRLAWAANYDLTAGPRDRVVKPVGTFGVNNAGLSDLKGNVWEWTATQCGDGGEDNGRENCRSGRYAMGEHEAVLSDFIRDPGNASCGAGIPPANLGFRLVYSSQFDS